MEHVPFIDGLPGFTYYKWWFSTEHWGISLISPRKVVFFFPQENHLGSSTDTVFSGWNPCESGIFSQSSKNFTNVFSDFFASKTMVEFPYNENIMGMWWDKANKNGNVMQPTIMFFFGVSYSGWPQNHPNVSTWFSEGRLNPAKPRPYGLIHDFPNMMSAIWGDTPQKLGKPMLFTLVCPFFLKKQTTSDLTHGLLFCFGKNIFFVSWGFEWFVYFHVHFGNENWNLPFFWVCHNPVPAKFHIPPK